MVSKGNLSIYRIILVFVKRGYYNYFVNENICVKTMTIPRDPTVVKPPGVSLLTVPIVLQ
jgi:hypothetical protein